MQDLSDADEDQNAHRDPAARLYFLPHNRTHTHTRRRSPYTSGDLNGKARHPSSSADAFLLL
jgi:hypothetical protein